MKFRHALIILTAAFTLSSCDFFTTSVGKGLARTNSDLYDKQSSSDLVNFASSPEVKNDPEASAKILEALGKKDDLDDLSTEEQKAILDLMVGNTITTDTIENAVNAINNIQGDDEVVELFDAILESVNTIDTTAAAKIIGNADNLEDLDPFTAVLASMSIMAQAAKTMDKSFEEIQDSIRNINTGDSPADVAESVLGAGDPMLADLTAALGCINYYNQPENEEKANSVAMGNLKVSDLIGAFGHQ